MTAGALPAILGDIRRDNVEYSGSAKLVSFKQFLVYSKRPLLVEEIAEVITLDANDDSQFDSV